MPILDLPLSQLQTYQGRNPRPDDFDAYWERALSALDATAPDAVLTPVDPCGSRVADCFDLHFKGVRGGEVFAKFYRPKHLKAPGPALLLFHGYSGSSGDWNDKLNYVAEGFCVAAMDVRGQGGRSVDGGSVRGNTLNGHIIRGLDDSPDALFFRQVFLDTAQLARVVMAMPEVDEERVGAAGGSQGGALTLSCAALEPRIRKAAPVFPFLCDYQRVWEMDQAKDAYAELRNWFRSFDPRHEREEEIFTRLGYIDNQHLASRIHAEVLMGTGLMDSICPPSTQFAAYNKIVSPKDVVIYPDFGHESLPGFQDRMFRFMMGL